jgi:hypothetical protein
MLRPSRVLPFLLIASLAPAAWAGPVIAVDEPAFDAGEVEQGALVEHAFVIRNTGDEPLQIISVRPSCGCTVAKDYERQIAPGASGSIPITLKTKGFRGKISKTISVTTNAGNEPRSILQVRATVTVPLEVLPNASVYIRGKTGEKVERALLLRPRRDGLQVTGASSNDPHVSVTLEPASVGEALSDAGPLAARLSPREGDQWLRVRLAEDVPAGDLSAYVTVTTSDPALPSVRVVVRARVQES